MKYLAVCDCDRKTGKETKVPKNPTITQHVNDICNYCGHYVKYISEDLVDVKHGSSMANGQMTRVRKEDGLDLMNDYWYNYGYPLGGRR